MMIIESICLLIGAFLWRYLRWRFSPLNKIPGPIKRFTLREWVIGVFATIEKEPFMLPQQRWRKEAGMDSKLLHYTGIFGRHFICVLDADGVKQVLTSKAGVDRPRFVKGLYYLKKVIGDGLVTIDGTKWHRHRRIIQPSFNNQFLKEALDSCVPDLMDRMVGAWKERAGSDIDLTSHFSALTLDIIGNVAFSHDFQSMDTMEQWAKDPSCQVELKDPLINGLYSSLMPSLARMLLVNLRLSWAEKYLMPEANKVHVILNKAVESVVNKAHERYKSRDVDSTKTKCLLELLFEAEDSEPGSRNRHLTHHELEEETKTFLVAGHETTSTFCVWAIYCLTQYPHVRKLVLEDILKHAPADGQIKLESLEKMSYFEAFLYEVLRLYPPVGMVVRNTGETVNLFGESIPPGTRVMIPIYLLHRNPDYWTEPECFKPERWMDQKTGRRLSGGERDDKFHHFAYLPFSAGARNCIGQRFAMWEAKLILAPLIREFDMNLSPSLDGVDLKLVSFITIKSVPPLSICVSPRHR